MKRLGTQEIYNQVNDRERESPSMAHEFPRNVPESVKSFVEGNLYFIPSESI